MKWVMRCGALCGAVALALIPFALRTEDMTILVVAIGAAHLMVVACMVSFVCGPLE